MYELIYANGRVVSVHYKTLADIEAYCAKYLKRAKNLSSEVVRKCLLNPNARGKLPYLSNGIRRARAKRHFGLTDRELDTLTCYEVPHECDCGRGTYAPQWLFFLDKVAALAESPAVQARLAKKAANNAAPKHPVQVVSLWRVGQHHLSPSLV